MRIEFGRRSRVCGYYISKASGLPGDRWKDILLDSIRQLIASRHALHDYVLVLDTGFLQLLLCTFEQRIDNFGVPPRVDDADAES
jgi:hypothetical protein